MKARLERVGASLSPVVIVDEFSGNVDEVIRIADALAPFPPVSGVAYPGVRRFLGPADDAAYSYVLDACDRAAPYIGGAFDFLRFDLTESSFSVVTSRPETLAPIQRVPHFDSPDQSLLAMLHYLRVPEGSGTAFYRHKSTGIERVTNDNLGQLAAAAEGELTQDPPQQGYMNAGGAIFEQIGIVEAIPDRLVIYQGSLLHSGIIPDSTVFSAAPGEGRLTANLFVRGEFR